MTERKPCRWLGSIRTLDSHGTICQWPRDAKAPPWVCVSEGYVNPDTVCANCPCYEPKESSDEKART